MIHERTIIIHVAYDFEADTRVFDATDAFNNYHRDEREAEKVDHFLKKEVDSHGWYSGSCGRHGVGLGCQDFKGDLKWQKF